MAATKVRSTRTPTRNRPATASGPYPRARTTTTNYASSSFPTVPYAPQPILTGPCSPSCRARTKRPAKPEAGTGPRSSRSGLDLIRGQECGQLGFDGRLAFDVDFGQESIQPARHPPVGVAEQFHRRGHEHHTNDGGVDQHCGGETEPDLLDDCLLYTSDAADERSSVDLGG